MAAIKKQQIKSIYALGAGLGMVEHGRDSHRDNLHQLVESLTGRVSVSALDADEADRVIRDLMHKMRGFPEEPKPRRQPKKYEETPGGMTAGQQRKTWELMYELRRLDDRDAGSALGPRLCGIIKRQFRMDASVRDPFRFLNYQQGRRLIEILKKYVENAELRRMRGDAV